MKLEIWKGTLTCNANSHTQKQQKVIKHLVRIFLSLIRLPGIQLWAIIMETAPASLTHVNNLCVCVSFWWGHWEPQNEVGFQSPLEYLALLWSGILLILSEYLNPQGHSLQEFQQFSSNDSFFHFHPNGCGFIFYWPKLVLYFTGLKKVASYPVLEFRHFLPRQIKCWGNYMKTHFALALPRRCFCRGW